MENHGLKCARPDCGELLVYSGLPEQERGRRFTLLARRFLQIEPKYAELYSEDWLWNEWPGREGKVDADMVLQDLDPLISLDPSTR